MPKVNDYGYGNFTCQKLADLRQFYIDYLAIVKAVINKHQHKNWCDDEFHYIDLNAGPAILNEMSPQVPIGTEGSPLLFCKAAEKYGLKWKADLIEKNLETGKELIKNMGSYRYQAKCWIEDHNTVIPEILSSRFIPWKFGLVFHDPNTGKISWGLLDYIKRFRPRYDILISMPGAYFKRKPECYNDEKLLSDYLEGLDKNLWFVKDLLPGDKQQWTFIFGTNMTDMREFTRIGLLHIHKPKGKEIFERVELSKKQQEDRQKKLQPSFFQGFSANNKEGDEMSEKYNSYEEYLRHPKYRAIRAEAIKRAGGICQHCKKKKVTEVHHLCYPKWGEFDELENLLPVCHDCHRDLEALSRIKSYVIYGDMLADRVDDQYPHVNLCNDCKDQLSEEHIVSEDDYDENFGECYYCGISLQIIREQLK